MSTEQDIPLRPTKRTRAESADEGSPSIGVERNVRRRLALTSPSHPSTSHSGSSSRHPTNECQLHTATSSESTGVTLANHNTRSSPFYDRGSAGGSSVSTLAVASTSTSAQHTYLVQEYMKEGPLTRYLTDSVVRSSTNTQHTNAIPNTPQPDLDWGLLARFGIPHGSDLTQLSPGEAVTLLNQIYVHLQNHAPGSEKYPQALRLLQDCCSYTNTLPAAFMVENVTFKRTDRIGRGGDALVYQGQMAGCAGAVVVRELIVPSYKQKQTIKREWVQLFYREAITHSQLQHPNILPFCGIYREDDESYPLIVLPYLERGSLEDILKNAEEQLIDSSILTKIVVGTARGVEYLHSRTPPIIHGDLHPGNILLNDLNDPILCDFGRSRIRHEVSRHLSTREEGGRIRFLAPELLDSRAEGFHSSEESDIYGLAMTYLNAWSGQPPFLDIQREFQVVSIVSKGERPIEPAQAVELDATVREEFWTLLVDMWAHEPAQRPASSDVLERSERILDSLKQYFPSGELHLPSIHTLDRLESLTTSNGGQKSTVMDSIEREKTREWLAPADPNVNQEERLKQGSKVPNHAQWLFDLESFQEWLRNPTGFFWISASAGVGKSVLCSQVVEHFQEDSSNSSSALAFFYFDYRDPAKEVFKKFLATCVEKLGNSSPRCGEILQSSDKSMPHASEKDLLDLFYRMLGTPGRKFLVIDAVDECRRSERLDSLLPFLQELMQKLSQNKWDLHIFATSRPEPDIEQLFDPTDGKGLISHRLRLGERPEHRATVAALIDAELNNPRFRGLGWSEDDFNYVKNQLLWKSDSMILWVHLQLQELDQCTGHEARQMLLTLPTSLDHTYARILSRITPKRRHTIRAVLECMIALERPFRLEEMEEILLLQLSQLDDQPQYLPLASTTNKHPAAMSILDICKLLPGLIRVGPNYLWFGSSRKSAQSVNFIHFTVQQYLLSSPMGASLHMLSSAAEALSTQMLSSFGTSLTKASGTLAIVLLSALDGRNSAMLPHLSRYAKTRWFRYVKSALPKHAYIAPTLAHFLDPQSQSFYTWVEGFYEKKNDYIFEKSARDHPLHWAVHFGSRDEVKRILALSIQPGHEGMNMRSALDKNGWSPICYAAANNKLDILSDLLEGNTAWATQQVGCGWSMSTVLSMLIESSTGSRSFATFWPPESKRKLPDLQVFCCLCDSATGVDLFAPDLSGDSPFTALFNHDSPKKFELMKLFLEKGADPNARHKGGLSLVHLAVEVNAGASFIHALVHNYGADVNALDNRGRTPLLLFFESFTSIFSRSNPGPGSGLEVIQSLLDEHANPNAGSHDGQSVLDYALRAVYHWLDKYIAFEVLWKSKYAPLPFAIALPEEGKKLDSAKRIYDLIEERGGHHSTLETPHGPKGRWSGLKPWQSSVDQSRYACYKDMLTKEKLEEYIKRLEWS